MADLTRFELDGTPCLALRPAADASLPVCLFLFGGGGTVEHFAALAPLLGRSFESEALAPMTIACAGVPPFCFYLDGEEGDWEVFVAERLLAEVRDRFPSTDRAGLVGISMGGYGALKIAFARPTSFSAVAAVAPMLEPSEDPAAVPLRNRYHYPPQVPARIRAVRDPAWWRSEHPAGRARSGAEALRSMAISIDAGSRDALCAQDGAEYLHRVLWDLDVPHDYHLWRDADHVGPTVAPRLEAAFAFVGRHLVGDIPGPTPEEVGLREVVAASRAKAAAEDPSLDRTYGRLRTAVSKK